MMRVLGFSRSLLRLLITKIQLLNVFRHPNSMFITLLLSMCKDWRFQEIISRSDPSIKAYDVYIDDRSTNVQYLYTLVFVNQ